MKNTVLVFMLLCGVASAQTQISGLNISGGHTSFFPTDINSISNWWSPDSVMIIDTTGTNTLSQWNDLVDGKNLAQSTKSRQPSQIALTNTANGNIFIAWKFNGVQSAMTNNAVANIATGNDIPISMFAVVRPFDAQNSGFVNFASSAASGVSSNQFTLKLLQTGTSMRVTRIDNTATTVNLNTTGVISNGFNFYAYSFNGTRILESLNGTLNEASFNVGQVDVDTFCVGALFRNGTFFGAQKADIVELAIFNGAIGTNGLINLYNNYARSKYNLP